MYLFRPYSHIIYQPHSSTEKNTTKHSRTDGITDYDIATTEQKSGVMSLQESLRNSKLSETVSATGQIADADMDWVIQEIHTPSLDKQDQTSTTKRFEMMYILSCVKNYTPVQREKMSKVALEFLASPIQSDKIWSMAIMKTLNDKSFIPYIVPLTHDQDAMVRLGAQRALKKLNKPTI